ncbi:MAG: DUF1730 domain-containing protein [Alistipes sp.]|nr:DUF1730 domain-containing protein [Alistipes sp.]
MLSYPHIKKYAAEAGFALCGVARARVLAEHAPRFEAGLGAASAEYMTYLSRRPERRFDPSELLRGARTVVVCALAYDGAAACDGVAAFARMDEDYHVRIKRMLREVVARLEACGLPAGGRFKVCCDTAPILEKAWAVEAGLGWQGRHSLVVNPRLGSFMMLGELLFDVECDCYDEPFSGVGCGSCRACVEACPVGAIGCTAEGVRTLSTARCISARTVEAARLRPETPVEPIHGWIEGCDECQRACPHNRWRATSSGGR